ncbi:MAG: histidine ammonia-lyase [Candidatus Nanopelagicales bacterium]
MRDVVIGSSQLTFEDVVQVARYDAPVSITDGVLEQVRKNRSIIDEMARSDVAVYGVSTGFGALESQPISKELRTQLQKSLIRSHAAGVGAFVETEVVRAMMFLRLKTMASGRTGVRPEVLTTYQALLNVHITPAVKEFGSLGCSGDLAPLSQCALALMGEGEVWNRDGELVSSASALAEAGISPLELVEKEGLALINGTDGMLGMLILALTDIATLLDAADVIAAMSVDGLMGTNAVFRDQVHELRPHTGQQISAKRMFSVLKDSGILASHSVDDTRVQDSYSLRCAPQVHGAVRDTLSHAARVAEIELHSVIDNPVILDDQTLASNGNFHGAPIAYVLDFLAIALTDLGSIAERRTDRLLDHHRSFGLPPFLAEDAGVDSGLMIAQYTQAGLVSENKRLSVPASVDSIPTSAMQEDHVSMGWHAARKLRKVIDNSFYIFAVELTAASRAIDLRAPSKPSKIVQELMERFREVVPGVGPDRYLGPELEAAEQFVRTTPWRSIVS